MTKGENIYKIAERLFPICRSITGNGVRETLDILKIPKASQRSLLIYSQSQLIFLIIEFNKKRGKSLSF